MNSIIIILFAIWVIAFGYAEENTASIPPAPPSSGDLGGTKSERIAFFERLLDTGTPEQQHIYRDDNPILKEVQKFFNQTLLVQVSGYFVHRSMLASSNNVACDLKAKEKCDEILRESFNETVACFAQFHQRVRSEVHCSITDISEVPLELRSSLILPVDDCLDEAKFSSMKKFGQNTVDHLVCSKNLKI